MVLCPIVRSTVMVYLLGQDILTYDQEISVTQASCQNSTNPALDLHKSTIKLRPNKLPERWFSVFFISVFIFIDRYLWMMEDIRVWVMSLISTVATRQRWPTRISTRVTPEHEQDGSLQDFLGKYAKTSIFNSWIWNQFLILMIT